MYAADTRHPCPSLQRKLEGLFTLRHGNRVDLSIRPEYFTLLRRLGDPHRALPPVIHVAGTNGKGSTIAFMRAVLSAAGYRVHVYTSPHLLRFNERIVLGGDTIGDGALEALLDEVLDANGDLPQTFFELTTALALTAFARAPGDIVLLETGLGGRLDSTNVIDHPALGIITPLSFDHTDLLGDSIAAIAGEKAGIFKTGTPVVIAPQFYPQAMQTLLDRAAAVDAPVAPWQWQDAPDFGVTANGRRLDNLPAPALIGAHQFINAATACAALLTQKALPVPDAAFADGLRAAHWPGRLHRIPAPPGWEIWFDGGHNDSAALALAQQAKDWAATDGLDLHIVTGMMANKDAAAFAAALAPHAASLTAIAIPGQMESCLPAAALAGIWHAAGARAPRAESRPWPDILASLTAQAPAGRVLVTGSLYLAATVLESA